MTSHFFYLTFLKKVLDSYISLTHYFQLGSSLNLLSSIRNDHQLVFAAVFLCQMSQHQRSGGFIQFNPVLVAWSHHVHSGRSDHVGGAVEAPGQCQERLCARFYRCCEGHAPSCHPAKDVHSDETGSMAETCWNVSTNMSQLWILSMRHLINIPKVFLTWGQKHKCGRPEKQVFHGVFSVWSSSDVVWPSGSCVNATMEKLSWRLSVINEMSSRCPQACHA